MTKKGREFNEIYDLTAMRVLVDSVKDCYGAIGVIHSLWKPLPGRFKDFVAMPKFNMYQALHTTVIGPEGGRSRSRSAPRRCTTPPSTASPRTGSTRTASGHARASKVEWLRAAARLAEGAAGPAGVRRDAEGRPVRGRGLRLHAEGRGQVACRGRDAARLRLRGPHRRRPPLRRGEGQRQDRAAALRAAVRRHLRGADLEEGARPVARLAVAGQDHARAVEDPRLVQARASRGLRAHRPRDPSGEPAAARACRRRRSPARRCSPTSSARWASARRDDFYIALGGEDLGEGRHQARSCSACAGRVRGGARRRRRRAARSARRRPQPTGTASSYGIEVDGHRRRDAAAGQVLPARAWRPDRRLHLARQGHHDPPRVVLERQGPDAQP